jgi:hypothetical protein
MPIVTKCFNRHKHKISPWITKGILKSLRTKDKLHSKLKKAKTENQIEILKRQYTRFRNIYQSVIRNAKKLYWENKFTECKSNIKLTWKNLNNILHRTANKKDFPNYFINNEHQISDHNDIANAFNQYYVNVGPKLAEQIRRHDNSLNFLPTVNLTSSFFMQPTTPDEITTIIKLLKPKTSCGYDGISPKLVKSCDQHAIVMPLTHIANLSFEKGIFPSELKTAKVLPIYKANDPTLFKNYRFFLLFLRFLKDWCTIDYTSTLACTTYSHPRNMASKKTYLLK